MEEQQQLLTPSGNTRPSGANIRGKNFQLTLNQIQKFESLWKYITERKNCNYAIACHEKAPTTGHEHIHLYCQFNNSVGLSVKKCEGAHIELCRGSAEQNVDYIKKDGNIIAEFGKLKKWGGKRIPSIGEIKSMDEKELADLPCNLINCVRRIRNEFVGKRYWQPVNVEWHYGPSGSGKTKSAFEAGAEPVEYHNGYFTDWGSARVIVLEEMRGQIPYPELLKILDDYHNYYKVNIKGGFKYIDFDTVYITSPKTPKECYPKQDEHDNIKQLYRRIDKIIYHDPKKEPNDIDYKDTDFNEDDIN